MHFEINRKEPPKVFVPFTLSITVTNLEELRTLAGVMGHVPACGEWYKLYTAVKEEKQRQN